ncbi:sialate O-acetylesterase [Pinibacter aurantiacus]|uniref:Sialate O-acetylesterase n=1 Tax=Pinibacter aurantiacus TaxID=2851599 RepID=A0A9E2SD29_9BACT|nr:sialate O-acetylesterase [Pinibacter aurantiacus]MBV4357625.1 sialate O-acetylesterase [Pinibacter aurantiacus]
MKLKISSLLFILSIAYSSMSAQVKLASLFTDNMVLQQQSDVAIWGWAKAGANISVTSSWNKKKYTAQANADGKWKLKIATPSYGGPYELTISDGKPVTLKNILIGEVWLCGGQSNMEMAMKGFKGQPLIGSNEAIILSKNKNIRLYTVPRSSVTTPQENSKPSEWKEANPESVSNFSAVGYYFGKRLNAIMDNVPIGLINCSYSGSSIQAWMNPETLKTFPSITIPKKDDSIKVVSRTPTTLYNGMMHPVEGYTIKGCIFYQGESNYEDPDLYEKLLPAAVKQWRSEWGIGDFPFYYTQIAPYGYKQLADKNATEKYNSAYLRDAQRKSVELIPNSAMSVLLDAGDAKTIHPMNKETPGLRLAYIALAKSYDAKGFGYLAPLYDSIKIKDTSAIVSFKNAENWLTSYGKKLANFEIAGNDKVFYPATASISKNTVIVSSPQVKQPVAVRYAFKDVPEDGLLFSTEGLPASSFRTDNW